MAEPEKKAQSTPFEAVKEAKTDINYITQLTYENKIPYVDETTGVEAGKELKTIPKFDLKDDFSKALDKLVNSFNAYKEYYDNLPAEKREIGQQDREDYDTLVASLQELPPAFRLGLLTKAVDNLPTAELDIKDTSAIEKADKGYEYLDFYNFLKPAKLSDAEPTLDSMKAEIVENNLYRQAVTRGNQYYKTLKNQADYDKSTLQGLIDNDPIKIYESNKNTYDKGIHDFNNTLKSETASFLNIGNPQNSSMAYMVLHDSLLDLNHTNKITKLSKDQIDTIKFDLNNYLEHASKKKWWQMLPGSTGRSRQREAQLLLQTLNDYTGFVDKNSPVLAELQNKTVGYLDKKGIAQQQSMLSAEKADAMHTKIEDCRKYAATTLSKHIDASMEKLAASGKVSQEEVNKFAEIRETSKKHEIPTVKNPKAKQNNGKVM